MKISTKGRYALRMLLYLAENQKDGYVSLKEVAENQNISKKYLEQIIPVFNNTNILIANRGSQGGHRLAQPPEKYTVGDILRLTEGGLSPISCLDNTPIQCERCEDCITLPVWQGLSQVINEYLDGITLQDIIENYRERNINDYVI